MEHNFNENAVDESTEDDKSGKSARKYTYNAYCDSPMCIEKRYRQWPSGWFGNKGTAKLGGLREGDPKPFACPDCKYPLFWERV